MTTEQPVWTGSPHALRYVKERWQFGRQNQTLLTPFLEEYLGEQITDTIQHYDTIDGKTETKDIEIKTRSKTYDWNDYFIMRDGWLLPACKIEHARTSGRPFLCFYYWKKDGSVWVFEYSEENMRGLESYVPHWHRDKQPHYNIPFSRWKQIGCLPTTS